MEVYGAGMESFGVAWAEARDDWTANFFSWRLEEWLDGGEKQWLRLFC